MNFLAIYGAGLLVGAAMIVIIPEGCLVMISAMERIKSSKQDIISNEDAGPAEILEGSQAFDTDDFSFSIGTSMSCGFSLMLIMDHIFNQLKIRKKNQELKERYEK